MRGRCERECDRGSMRREGEGGVRGEEEVGGGGVRERCERESERRRVKEQGGKV